MLCKVGKVLVPDLRDSGTANRRYVYALAASVLNETQQHDDHFVFNLLLDAFTSKGLL